MRYENGMWVNDATPATAQTMIAPAPANTPGCGCNKHKGSHNEKYAKALVLIEAIVGVLTIIVLVRAIKKFA